MSASPESATRISNDRWPIWLWGITLFMAGSVALAIEAAISSDCALIALLIQIFLLITLEQNSPLTISCSAEMLYVGKASIERKYISQVEALDAEAMRITRGPQADPAAYLALRFWVSTGVKVVINDPNDSTPYWLISTKAAKKLVEALH